MGAIIDTSVLMEDADVIDLYDRVYLNPAILEEIDNHKTSLDSNKAFKARRITRKLESATNIEYIIYESYKDMPKGLDPQKRDNFILCDAIKYELKLLTNDLVLIAKAKAFNIEVSKHYLRNFEEYHGFKEVKVPDSELAKFYETNMDRWGLVKNQYLIINGEAYVKTDDGFRALKISPLNSQTMGKIKPMDIRQRCFVDSLCNNKMTLIKGQAGTGKSLLSLAYAFSQMDTRKIDKIIIFVNPVPVKNSKELGFYPGTKNEKLLESQIGNMLEGKLGGKTAVEILIKSEKLVLMPISDIRGFDSTGMRALIYITEAQNMDIELMRLAIQRIGDDCQLIIDGDYNAQVDSQAYEGFNNGMRRVSEVFRGHEFYGEVELSEIYRSEMAKIAQLM